MSEDPNTPKARKSRADSSGHDSLSPGQIRFAELQGPVSARQESLLRDRLAEMDPASGGRGRALRGALEAQVERCLRHDPSEALERMVRDLLRLPGFGLLAPPTQSAVIAQIHGPDLGLEVARDRQAYVAQLWRYRRARIAQLLDGEALHQASAPEQAELLRSYVEAPERRSLFLWQRMADHAVLVIGAATGRAWISYGRVPCLAAHRRIWSMIETPDRFIERGWPAEGPLAEAIYEAKAYGVSRDDERRVVEWIEGAFAVGRRVPRAERQVDNGFLFANARSFADYVQQIYAFLGRRRPNGGVLEAKYYRKGQPWTPETKSVPEPA